MLYTHCHYCCYLPTPPLERMGDKIKRPRGTFFLSVCFKSHSSNWKEKASSYLLCSSRSQATSLMGLQALPFLARIWFSKLNALCIAFNSIQKERWARVCLVHLVPEWLLILLHKQGKEPLHTCTWALCLRSWQTLSL